MNRAKETALKDVKLFALDMDGTIYLGEQLIAGSLDFVHQLKDQNIDFIFFTNNSSRISSYYQEKLKKMNFVVDQNKIITSGDVTIDYLKRNYPEKNVYLMGTPLLESSFREKGINLVEEAPDVVVASFDTTLTYDKLDKICRFIRGGAIFLATHPDLVCPTETGSMPDCGAICALITAATGIEPKYLGKPNWETMAMVMARTGYEAKSIAFVGDRLYTDVASGVNNGGKGFLVLTGEATMADVTESKVQPDCVFESLNEMIHYL